MSQMSISGMVSGLDTTSIINQLVQVQANQQTLLQNQQAAVQKTSDAYTQLATYLTSLSTVTSDLENTANWQGTTATSSDSSVTATTTSNVSSSLTFDVTDIARAHTLISSATYGSLNDIAAGGTLTLTQGTTATAVNVGSGSLTDVVNAINNANAGYTAAAVQVGTNQYRLQVASTTTGANSAFTISGTGTTPAMSILTTGTDATVHVGTGAAAYDATSSTNTFSSLVSGISFTVSKPNVSGVTISSSVDGSAVATKIQKMVDAANTVLSYINTQSAYDTSTQTGGALLGETTVQSLQQNILSAVSTAGAAGVHVTRDGTLTFDQTEFTTAYKANPAKVAAAFGATATFTQATQATATSLTLAGSTDDTRAGTYGVTVTSAAQRESWSMTPQDGVAAGHVIALTRGATSISYTGAPGATLDDAATEINKQAAAAGMGISAAVSNGALVFTAAGFGTAGAFTASLDTVNGTKVTAGADVQGTIDGQAAKGLGNVLSLTSGTGGALGLSLQVSTTAADIAATGGALGTVSYTPGLAQKLTTLVNDATNSTTGVLTTAEQSQQAEIKDLQDQIDAWNDRLSAYRDTITREFTTMETTLSSLKSSMSAISGLSTSMLSSDTSSSSSSSSSG
jgi:flagellar hook-associated protein 2